MFNMPNEGEATPLLPSNAIGDGASKYYFLKNEGTAVTATGELVEETAPQGTTEEEFAPRAVQQVNPSPYIASRKTLAQKQDRSTAVTGSTRNPNPPSSSSWLGRLFGSNQPSRPYGEAGTLVKLRKAPIKVEPKVFFANERTFLAWMHLSVILAGASIAILAFSDESSGGVLGQLYGVVLLPVAISFILYSMYQYHRRATMIRNRHPGPYEDTVGPTVLGVMLMMSIVAQFSLKMYALSRF